MSVSVARIATVVSLALAVVAIFILMFGGLGSNYRVEATFQNAGQLVKGNRVLIGGNTAGKVADIELTDTNEVDITLEVSDEYAPLHEGTTMTQRRESLAGVGNGYISVNPGPNNRPEIADGARIGSDRTTSVVNIDQFYSMFDADTRKSLRTLIRQASASIDGKGRKANEAFKYLGPALGSSSSVIGELTADQEVFERFIIDSSRLATALADRRDDLAALVSNADTAAGAVARENAALSEAIDELPSTLRTANTTFVNLRKSLDTLDPLVKEMEPAADALDPFLEDLRPVLKDGRPAIRDLRRIVSRKGKDNDLTDLLVDAKSVGAKSDTAFPNAIEGMKDLQPVLDFGVPYSPDLTGFITRLAEVPAYYDANGHMAKVNVDTLNFNLQGSTLVQNPGSSRDGGLQTGRLRRCPGGATQASADGSSPFLPSTGSDCDLSTVPPGP